MKKLGQDTAFPVIDESIGMNKRFYAACAAMQGLLAGGMTTMSKPMLVKCAYEYTDELLRQEQDEKI